MANQPYSASLSRTQGRSGYSIIFRHPVRLDPATGKPGVRVRRGLGTRDDVEAERLRDQLNDLLSDTKYHQPSARTEAERRFDQRIVAIFFDNMVPEPTDFEALREAVIQLPSYKSNGYRRVLLLGTTGAGKTTLVRQLIGTDPEKERFPSTSTAKTTIHDTEIVMSDGAWRAVVTFVGIDEVREYLNECISAAVLAAARGPDDAEILRRLLNHVDQRFRFNYVLGNGPKVSKSNQIADFDDEDEEPDDQGELLAENGLGDVDLAATNEILDGTVGKLRELADRHRDHVRETVGAQEEKDKRVADEIFEEELDNLLRDDEDFHHVADALMDQIANRFETLPPGKEVRKTRQGWPLSWSGEWPVENRAEFLRAISLFSSNYAPLFGRLLTPLVNGVRVAGPFVPKWSGDQAPKLVLLDGEGLGHTPRSSSAVSTAVSRQIDAADAVLLVDNATEPMQAAPIAAMSEIVTTGNARKLILAFTHFDQVKGDNLPNASAKALHVLASAENVLAAFAVQHGRFGELALRQRLEEARFFLGGLQEPLAQDDKEGKGTIDQLHKLLAAIDRVKRPESADARPVYDRLNLGFAIQDAAKDFHAAWRSLLGLESGTLPKEHWTRIKALNRRLAEGMADEYDTLHPIADLRKELKDRIYVFIQNPLGWNGADSTQEEQEPTEEEKRNTYDTFTNEMSQQLLELSRRRLRDEFIGKWQDAYRERGHGSTFRRARIIGDQIYRPAAPVPDATPSPDHNQFLREVIDMAEAVAQKIGAELR